MRPNHYELQVWQEARLLVRDVYAVTTGLPADGLFGLVAQACRGQRSVEHRGGRRSRKHPAIYTLLADCARLPAGT